MRVVHIIPSLNTGGAERFVVDLCNEFAKDKSVKVFLIVFFNTNSETFLRKELDSNVFLIELNKRLGFDFLIIFKLLREFIKIRPNVVNTHLGAFEYCTIVSLFFRNKIKFYHTLHSDAFFEAGNKYLRTIKKFLFKFNIYKPITISVESSKSFHLAYSLDNDKIIFNGRSKLVKTNDFEFVRKSFETEYRITSDTKVILTVGSIQYIKNQLNLVKATQNVINRKLDVVLLVIGSPRYDGDTILKDLLEYSSIRIHLLGNKHNVADYLILSDIFCLSSLKEGMPISLIEAFSLRKVCVCTPAGGIVDMISNNNNGLLTEGFEIENLEDGLIRAITLSKMEKEKLQDNAYKTYLENYSIDRTKESYLDLYK